MEIPNLIKKSTEKKRTIPLLNIIFILLLICASIIVGFFVGRGQNIESGDILGEKKQITPQKTANNSLAPSPGSLLGTMSNGVEKTLQDTLKHFTSVITDTASKSANSVSDTIFDSSVGTVLKQIDKLPEKQRDDIKRNICE